MAKFGIEVDGFLQDEVFDTEEEAEEYAAYLSGCGRLGAEILYMSNPYENESPDDYEEPFIEVVELD